MSSSDSTSIARDKSGPADYGAEARRQAGISDDDPRVREPEKITAYAIFVALVAAFSGVLYGYDTGQISGFLEIEDYNMRFGEPVGTGYDIPVWREGAIVSLLSVGTLFGSLAGGPLGDTSLGRKGAMWIGNLVVCVGLVVQLTTFESWVQMMMARFLTGLGVGMLSSLTPLYIGETAPKNIRGTMLASYQFCITIGLLIAYLVNLGAHNISGDSSWKLTIGLTYVFPALMSIGLIFVPESPRFLLSRGKDEQAIKGMEKIRGVFRHNINLAADLDDMRALINTQSQEDHGWSELVYGTPKVTYRVVLGFFLQVLQQLSGVNLFLYYGTTLFAGVGIDNSFITSVILGAVNMGCTPIGLFVIERFGRRRTLFTGSLWMAMCFLVYAVVGLAVTEPDGPPFPNADPTYASGVTLIVFTCLYLLGFSTTWSVGIWAVNGEMHKASVRAKAISVSTAGNWLANTLLALTSAPILGAISYAYGFVFMVFNLVGAAVVWFFVYETAGRSLEEIDAMFAERKLKPWQSAKWQPPAKKAADAYTEREHKYGQNATAAHVDQA